MAVEQRQAAQLPRQLIASHLLNRAGQASIVDNPFRRGETIGEAALPHELATALVGDFADRSAVRQLFDDLAFKAERRRKDGGLGHRGGNLVTMVGSWPAASGEAASNKPSSSNRSDCFIRTPFVSVCGPSPPRHRATLTIGWC